MKYNKKYSKKKPYRKINFPVSRTIKSNQLICFPHFMLSLFSLIRNCVAGFMLPLVRTCPVPRLINKLFHIQVTTTQNEEKIPSFSGEIKLCKTVNPEKSVTLPESLGSHAQHVYSTAITDS